MRSRPSVAVNKAPAKLQHYFMSREYRFVGRPSVIPKADEMPPRFLVDRPEAILLWQASTRPEKEWDGSYPATFVVDLDGKLWIADRRSEHVACARTSAVLAAGEMFFIIGKAVVSIARVTNQSTGYCPEPSSWSVVTRSLENMGIPHPAFYDEAFEFRYCLPCKNICIIKDADFTCPQCSKSLPLEWNLVEAHPH